MVREVRLRWWVFALLSGAFAIALSFYFDDAVQSWIEQHQNPALRAFMQSVSRIGDWPGQMLLGCAGLFVAYLRRSRKWMRVLAAMLLACALAGSTTRVIKIVAGRARPDVQSERQWHGFQVHSRYNAFPSGHTAASSAFFAVLALTSWRVGLPLLIIPLLIGFSRLYVVAHRLSDAITGGLIGLLAAYLITRWFPAETDDPRSKS